MTPMPLSTTITPRMAPARLPITLALLLALGLEALLLFCANATMVTGVARSGGALPVVLNVRPSAVVLTPSRAAQPTLAQWAAVRHPRVQRAKSVRVMPGRAKAALSMPQSKPSAPAARSMPASPKGVGAGAEAGVSGTTSVRAVAPTVDLVSAFTAELRVAIQATLRYPPNARALGLQGKVRVAIGCAGGYCDQATLIQSSGNPWFDRAALQAVVDARVAVPEDLARTQSDRYLVTVRFELARSAI